MREPPLYRPFALIALAATLLVATPLGTWMLARLHWGGGPIPAEHVWLHAHLQVFGFFGTLIVGVAHHLVPRFAGRPVAATRLARWIASGIGTALALRIGGAAAGIAVAAVAAAVVQACAFGLFGVWVWRMLGAPGAATTRLAVGMASGWLTAGLVLEAVVRAPAALGPDALAGPEPAAMRAVHVMALYGGVSGWIAGVALRAGPMLVPRWRVPDRLARLVPWSLALGTAVASVGAVGPWPLAARVALEWAGEALALATVATVALTGGAFRRAPGAVPLVAHGGPETHLFRLAIVAVTVSAAGSVAAAGLAWAGVALSLLADALRHLMTVGFLTAMVLAMGFRLVPMIEGVAVPWPRLRELAFGALVTGVLLRTAEVLADYGLVGALAIVPLSGALVWLALGCLAACALGAVVRRRGL